MSENPTKPQGLIPREERLAAKLRENLRRRKVQARELDGDSNAGLSKKPPSS